MHTYADKFKRIIVLLMIAIGSPLVLTAQLAEQWHSLWWSDATPALEAYRPHADSACGPVSAEARTQGESGTEWFHDAVPVYDDGEQIGYAAAGYTTWRNGAAGLNWLECDSSEFGFYHRQIVVMFDLDGDLLWSKYYLGGQYKAIIQDHEGNLIVSGWGASSSGREDNGTGTNLNGLDDDGNYTYEVMFNGDPGDQFRPAWSLVTSVGGMRQYNVAKLDIEGNVIWNSYYGDYGSDTEAADALKVGGGRIRTEALSLIETYDKVNELWEYRTVGWGPNGAHTQEHPMMVDISADGSLPNGLSSITTWDTEFPAATNGLSQAMNIERLPVADGEHYVITGYNVDIPNAMVEGWIMYMDGFGTITPNGFTKLGVDYATYLNATYSGYTTKYRMGCEAILLRECDGLKIVWGTLGEFQGGIFAGPHYANMHILKLNASTMAMEAETDLDAYTQTAAYDLHVHLANARDGNIWLSTSRMGATGAPDPATSPFDDFVTDCLEAGDGAGGDLGPLGGGNFFPGSALNLYDYFNTDGFVAKLQASDLSLLDHLQFDPDPGTDYVCTNNGPDHTAPDDWDARAKECIFDVEEAQDGGIVVVGNASKNWDDGYIVKLHDCDENAVQVTIMPDKFGSQTTWAIKVSSSGVTVCSGGPYTDNCIIPVTTMCCLPDGCYRFEVYDSNSDGMCCAYGEGGYMLSMADGRRILDNAPVGDGSAWSTSSTSITSNEDFCLELGALEMEPTSCDITSIAPTGPFIVLEAVEDPAVTAGGSSHGYQFQLVDPDGGYVRGLTQTNGAVGPAGHPRRLSFALWNTLFPPEETLLNVRVRSVIPGTTTKYGPVCRFEFEDCCGSQLMDLPNSTDYPQTCGATITVTGTARLWAYPRSSFNGCSSVQEYRYTLTYNGTTYTAIRTGNSCNLTSNWSPSIPPCGYTYTGEVDVKIGGVWNTCGGSCSVTLACPVGGEGGEDGGGATGIDASGTGTPLFTISPNPNDGSMFTLTAEALLTNGAAIVAVTDIAGRRVGEFKVVVESGAAYSNITFPAPLAAGTYNVILTLGDQRLMQRMVVR